MQGKVTYGLYGKSGTGKSHQSHIIREQKGISLMIDDGLLIKNNKIITGTSAKITPYLMESIRISLFEDEDHRKEIYEAIKKEKEKKILVLGTSKKMIQKICNALDIPEPKPADLFNIEEISSPKEIELARKNRNQGLHIIPVESADIKQKYPKIFKGGIIFRLKNKFPFFNQKKVNKSIVNPLQDFRDSKIAGINYVVAEVIFMQEKELSLESVKVKKIKTKKNESQYVVFLEISLLRGRELKRGFKYISDKITLKAKEALGVDISNIEFKIKSVMIDKN